MIPRLLLLAVAVAGTALLSWWLPRLDRPPTRFEVARQLIDEGRAEIAVHLFEQPPWRGVAEYRAGRYRRALGEFFLEESVLTLYNMGTAYAQLREWDGAIAAYEKALRLEPGHADARHNLAIVIEAAALSRRLLAESRTERKLGQWKDGNRDQPEEPGGEDAETVGEGQPGEGESREADAAVAGAGTSTRPGLAGDKVLSENSGTGATAEGGTEAAEPPADGKGTSAVALARENRQAAEIMLRKIVDDPARVLAARLYHAHRSRLAGKTP